MYRMVKLIILSILQSALLCGGQVMLKLGVAIMDRSHGWKHFFIHSLLTNRYLLGCGLLMTSAGLLWMYILRHFHFSHAYPLSSLSFVFGMLAAMWVFHETVDWRQWIGLILILVGCYFIAK